MLDNQKEETGPEMVPFPDMPILDNVTLPLLALRFEVLAGHYKELQGLFHDEQLEHERLKRDVRKIKRGFRECRRYRFGRY